MRRIGSVPVLSVKKNPTNRIKTFVWFSMTWFSVQFSLCTRTPAVSGCSTLSTPWLQRCPQTVASAPVPRDGERRGRGRRQPRQHGVQRQTSGVDRPSRPPGGAGRRVIAVIRRRQRTLGGDGVSWLVDYGLYVATSVFGRAVRAAVSRLDLLGQVVETLESAANYPDIQQYNITVTTIISSILIIISSP